jgi:hypothetical protein
MLNSLDLIIEKVTKAEKNGCKCIVYKVLDEDGTLIYTGIGGKGSRKGSGRLKEHRSNSMYSSFRFQFYIDKWDQAFFRSEADEMWNNLKWSFVGFQDIEDALKYETKLIKEFNPKYNRDKK